MEISHAASNEKKVMEALALLPERAAKELQPGEIASYVVVRMCDEITGIETRFMGKLPGLDLSIPLGYQTHG